MQKLSKKVSKHKDENYYNVKMTKEEMLQMLRLYFGKEDAEFDELENSARNIGGLAYHLVECYNEAE